MPIFRKDTKPTNPFILSPFIPDDYFCDRKGDTETLVNMIDSGNNIVLTADRRIGKSALLHHILNQKEIRHDYNTLYVDIYNTHCAEDFIKAMKNAISDPGMSTFPKAFTEEFETITQEYGIKGEFKSGPISLAADYRAQQRHKDVDVIEKIFKLLSEMPRKNLIVFDEFQQIEKYPDNITALLRSKIQMLPNTRFVYSGSSVHMLTAMFTKDNQPFFNSSSIYGLKRIPSHVYSQFCHDQFRKYDKGIDPEAVSFTHDLMLGNTLGMQQVMNRAFDMTPKFDNADMRCVRDAVCAVLEDRGDLYEAAFARLNAGEKKIVACIAMEGLATGLTSSAMIAKYGLGASSSITNHLKSLSSEDRKVIQKVGKAYMISDRFFELWIAQQGGLLEEKFNLAAALRNKYNKERAASIPLSEAARETIRRRASREAAAAKKAPHIK